MEDFPEITFEVHGKKMTSDDYGWEDKDFVVIDKETSKKYIFKNAYFSNSETSRTIIVTESTVEIPVVDFVFATTQKRGRS